MSDREKDRDTAGGAAQAQAQGSLSGDSARAAGGGPREADSSQCILSLLGAQATLYAKLEACATGQRELIEQDDVKPLLTLLGDRRRITDALAEVSERLRPVRERWDEFRESFTPAEKDQAERLIDEAKERMRRLMNQDETDTRLLAAKKQFTARALGAVHARSQAITAYQVSDDQSGRAHSLQEES